MAVIALEQMTRCWPDRACARCYSVMTFVPAYSRQAPPSQMKAIFVVTFIKIKCTNNLLTYYCIPQDRQNGFYIGL